MKTCAQRTHVGSHFDGTISQGAERAMREHLPGCDSCRLLYRRQLLLSRLYPEALSAEALIARGLGFRPKGRRMPYAAAGLGLAGVAAAALLLVVLKSDASKDGFSSRGGRMGASPLRASRVIVYDVPRGGP